MPRKSNWIVAAIAAVACGVLLWAWFALGFNHMDDPLDLVVAAVVGGIVWAEGKRREKMRLAFIGEGVVYNPEAGLVMPDAGESELAARLYAAVLNSVPEYYDCVLREAKLLVAREQAAEAEAKLKALCEDLEKQLAAGVGAHGWREA